MNNVVSVFGASRTEEGSLEWQEAERLGELLAQAGYTVATGGYSGSMEAVSKGARRVPGEHVQVIGVTAPKVFPARVGANAFVTEEVAAEHLLERIHVLTEKSIAAVALPGSLGTFTEIMVAWNLAQLAPLSSLNAKPIIAVGKTWKKIITSLATELDISSELVQHVDTVDEVLTLLPASEIR